jgi:hypothetical protein
VEAVNGWPLKKVALISLGIMGAAKAARAERSMPATANGPTRIKKSSHQNSLSRSPSKIYAKSRRVFGT